jgi:hypothetical protein
MTEEDNELPELASTPEQQAAEEAAEQEAYELDCDTVETLIEAGKDAQALNVARRWDGLPEIAKRLIKARDERKADVGTTEIRRRKLIEPEAPPLQPTATPTVRGWAEVAVPEGANPLEALTYVPGVVGDITEWIVRGAIRPNRMLALGVAVTVVGTLIGRWVQGPTGSGTHLLIVIIGPSGFGKDDPLKLGKALMTAVGAKKLIGPDEFASAPGFTNLLKRSPLLICFVDEIGDELAKFNDQQGNPYVAALVGLFKKLYNAWEVVDTAEKVGVETENITWPAVSLVGAATPEMFFAGIKPKDLESGFANRLMILPFEGIERPPEQERPGNWDVPPKELVEALKRLPRQKPHSALDLDAPRSGKLKRLDMMPWGPGAKEEYYAFSQRLDALVETDPRRDQLSKRGAENASRLATDMAIGRGSPTCDLEDIRWGIAFAERSIEAAYGGYEKYMHEYYAFPKFCAQVLAKIASDKRRFRTEAELRHDFRNNSKTIFDLPNAIRQLELEHKIIRGTRKGTRGPESEPGYTLIDNPTQGFTAS